MSHPPARYRGRHGTGSAAVKLVIAIAVLAVGAAAIYGVTMNGNGGGAQRLATSELATVSKVSFDITTVVTGDLQAKKQIEIRSGLESESTIVEIIPEGTVAKKGQVLVILNSDNIATRLQEEESRVESARAELTAADSAYSIQLSENDSKHNQAKLKLTLAQLAREQWEKGERIQRLKDIELNLDNTAKELERLTEKYELSQALHVEGFLSKDELQRDEIALRKATADREKALLEQQTYNQYQEPMDRARKVSDVTEAAAELDRVTEQNKSQLASKEADLVNRRRQLQIRSENAAKLRRQLAACTMVAPQDGLVVYASSMNDDSRFNNSGPLMVGRRVNSNELLIILPDTSEMIAQVRVHESLAGRVRRGQSATVRVDAAGGQVFSGQVESIGVLAEGGGWRDPNRREYTVKIHLDTDYTGNLKPSMRCEATIVLGRVEDSLALPVQAVFTEDPVKFVYVPRSGKYARIPVQVGQRSDMFAQVISGVKEGDRVLMREPTPGEVLLESWDENQLKTVGLKYGEDGKVQPIDGPRNPAMAGRREVAVPGGGGPAQERTGAGRSSRPGRGEIPRDSAHAPPEGDRASKLAEVPAEGAVPAPGATPEPSGPASH
jgi:HlyD family secretion protein